MRVGPMTPSTPTTSLSSVYGAVTTLQSSRIVVARLLADEDLHAFGPQALVEQVQDVALLVERLEQAPQLLDVRQLGEAHQVGFAGDDIFHAAAADRPSTTCCASWIASSISWFMCSRVSCSCARMSARTCAQASLPRELFVQKIRGAPQLVGE